ncbi:MAG TPA: hypothetical protein VFD92_21965 [Candidatus Binatia bacterium]|nr:hypothetical protein [Candidatus Binatia bacterium]
MGRRAQRKRSAAASDAIAARRSARDRERLARLAEGGTPERPITIESASQVEVVAESMRCPLCDGGLRVLAHEAQVVDGARRRAARVVCRACGSTRAIWFALAGVSLH